MGWLDNQMTKDLQRVPRSAEEAAKAYKRSKLVAMLLWLIAVLQLTMGLLLDVLGTAVLSGLIFALSVIFMAQAFDMRHWYHRLSVN